MSTTADEVWKMLGELIQAQKETDRKFQETDRKFQETDRKFQETERLLRQQSQKLNEQLGKLGNRLGEFVESQVRPAAVKLFQERGIAVKEIASNVSVQQGNEGLEIDLLVIDGLEAIAIEVKSKLSQDDVDEHLQRLAKFKRLLPRYENFQILGAVAAMVITNEVASYANGKGLFIIAQSGDNLVILNDSKFQPRVW